MPRRAAAGLHLHLERREVELVVEGGNIGEFDLEEAHRFADRTAALVHEGGRLQQQDAFRPDPTERGPALELLLPGLEAMHLGDRIDGHEADIVPVERILRPRIAEADPELHGSHAPPTVTLNSFQGP
jgi:hypothetical protein